MQSSSSVYNVSMYDASVYKNASVYNASTTTLYEISYVFDEVSQRVTYRVPKKLC